MCVLYACECGCLPIFMYGLRKCVCVNSPCAIRRYFHGEEQRQVETCGLCCTWGRYSGLRPSCGHHRPYPFLSSLTQQPVVFPGANLPSGQGRGFTFLSAFVPQGTPLYPAPWSYACRSFYSVSLATTLGQQVLSHRWEKTQTSFLDASLGSQRCLQLLLSLAPVSSDTSVPWLHPGL